MRFRPELILPVALTLTACSSRATTNNTPLEGRPLRPSQIRVLSSVRCPYDVVEAITIRRNVSYDNLRWRAFAAGADALTAVERIYENRDDGRLVWVGLEASAIRFTEPGCRR